MTETHYARIAAVYDTIASTQYDVPFFLAEARKAGGAVLELMAGTGRLTIPLVTAGIPLSAIDYSAEMIAILRDKLAEGGLSADVQQADVREMQLGRRFKQVILPFQAFHELTAEEDQRRALERIAEHLDDDWLFICTLHNPAVRLRSVDDRLRLAGRHDLEQGGHLLFWLLQRRRPDTGLVEVLEFFEEYDAQGVMQAKRYSELEFRLIEKDRFESLTAEAGFEVVSLYGDYDTAPFDPEASPFMIWSLRRKG